MLNIMPLMLVNFAQSCIMVMKLENFPVQVLFNTIGIVYTKQKTDLRFPVVWAAVVRYIFNSDVLWESPDAYRCCFFTETDHSTSFMDSLENR